MKDGDAGEGGGRYEEYGDISARRIDSDMSERRQFDVHLKHQPGILQHAGAVRGLPTLSSAGKAVDPLQQGFSLMIQASVDIGDARGYAK